MLNVSIRSICYLTPVVLIGLINGLSRDHRVAGYGFGLDHHDHEQLQYGWPMAAIRIDRHAYENSVTGERSSSMTWDVAWNALAVNLFVLIFALTISAVLILRRPRRRLRSFQWSYKCLFGVLFALTVALSLSQIPFHIGAVSVGTFSLSSETQARFLVAIFGAFVGLWSWWLCFPDYERAGKSNCDSQS